MVTVGSSRQSAQHLSAQHLSTCLPNICLNTQTVAESGASRYRHSLRIHPASIFSFKLPSNPPFRRPQVSELPNSNQRGHIQVQPPLHGRNGDTPAALTTSTVPIDTDQGTSQPSWQAASQEHCMPSRPNRSHEPSGKGACRPTSSSIAMHSRYIQIHPLYSLLVRIFGSCFRSCCAFTVVRACRSRLFSTMAVWLTR